MSLLKSITLALTIAVPINGYCDIAVISNPNIKSSNVDKEDIAQLYLAKTSTLPGDDDDTRIFPVDQVESSSIRAYFYERICSKSPDQVKAYWSKLIFTGKGMPPKELENDKAVIEYVRTTVGAVGYVSVGSLDSTAGVKVLATFTQ